MRGGAALLSVDHCFSIKGQGTVMTGTVLQVVPIVDLFTVDLNLSSLIVDLFTFVDLDLQFSSKGEVKVGDSLEIPALNETRKVKSIQMFRVRQNKIKKR